MTFEERNQACFIDKKCQCMLYSSKNYLENMWFEVDFPVWLAHYTEQTTYEGDYYIWQLCSNGTVPGIKGAVDINVMYN